MNRFPFSWAGDRAVARGECQPSVEPLPGVSHPAGLVAPAGIQQRQRHRQRLSRTARQVLASPHLMRRLSDRVYALWEAEQRQQQERDRPNSRQ